MCRYSWRGAGEEVGDDVVAVVDVLGVRAPGRLVRLVMGPMVMIVISFGPALTATTSMSVAVSRTSAEGRSRLVSNRPGFDPGLIPAPTGFEPGSADS